MKRKLLILIALIVLVFFTSYIVAKANNSKQYNYQVTMQDINRALTNLPVKYVQQFYLEGWRFIITDTDKNYYGLIDINLKVIYIYNKPHTSDITITDTVLHEFGHYWDYTNGWISNSKEFLEIYNNHSYTDPNRNDDYCHRNPQELFATMFRDKFN